MAVQALKRREVERIILTRPAVEAGEKLGFLPGDLQEKIDPYLRPLYDGLTIRSAPTLRSVIWKKASSRTRHWRTCVGARWTMRHHSRRSAEHHAGTDEDVPHPSGLQFQAVITGDITQIDLPRDTVSG